MKIYLCRGTVLLHGTVQYFKYFHLDTKQAKKAESKKQKQKQKASHPQKEHVVSLDLKRAEVDLTIER